MEWGLFSVQGQPSQPLGARRSLQIPSPNPPAVYPNFNNSGTQHLQSIGGESVGSGASRLEEMLGVGGIKERDTQANICNPTGESCSHTEQRVRRWCWSPDSCLFLKHSLCFSAIPHLAVFSGLSSFILVAETYWSFYSSFTHVPHHPLYCLAFLAKLTIESFFFLVLPVSKTPSDFNLLWVGDRTVYPKWNDAGGDTQNNSDTDQLDWMSDIALGQCPGAS